MSEQIYSLYTYSIKERNHCIGEQVEREHGCTVQGGEEEVIEG